MIDVTPKPPTNGETYLGDGLYASCDGWMIRLRAPGDAGADHVVYLDPHVYGALRRFAAAAWNAACGEEEKLI